MDTQKQGAEDDTGQIGCGQRLLRGSGILLLALLLLTAVLYACEVYRCTRYTPTGDALYDRYARAVIQRQAWKLFHNTGTHPATLPDELLAGWEPDFGSDPRYWQLRFWCAKHRFDNFGIFLKHHPWIADQEPSQQAAEQHLDKARELGVADADTLWFLLQEERVDIRHSWSKVEQETEALTGDERRNKLQEHGRWAEERELELLEAMVQAGPDEAWPYYWRARYWFELGEQELAQADLKAGNQAADNHIPRLFPVSAVFLQLPSKAGYGSQCVAGAVLEVHNYDAVTNWVKWREVALEIQVSAALGGDLSLVTDFHRFACRIGSADSASQLEAYYGQLLVAMQPPYILSELSSEMTTGQRRALWEIYGRANNIERNLTQVHSQLVIQHPSCQALGLLNLSRIYQGSSKTQATFDATRNEMGRNTLRNLLMPVRLYQHYRWIAQVQLQAALDMRDSFAGLEQADYEDLEGTVEIVW